MKITSFLQKYALICSILFMLLSCDIEHSSNGKFDGYWKITRIDTLQTGGINDLSGELRFWSVQGKLLQLNDRQNYRQPCYLRFEKKGEQLRLYSPYADVSQGEDLPMTDAEPLRHWGINLSANNDESGSKAEESLEEKFTFESLTSSNMVLASQTLRLYFKRY